MPQPIVFANIQAYLNGIVDNFAAGDIGSSPHKRFWNVKYQDFITGIVPKVLCNGQQVPIINRSDPVNSAFHLILKARWCNKGQMPGGGPYLTDAGAKVTLADGTVVAGSQILADIGSWLTSGYPEK